ncbi:NUDIX hydrolase [Leptolyngbya sp. AN02str]|uniref:NUDIX hydrolase n=1 Tax=Leptolyngbya sp. AN02str TaxID=3423363 RepID=UPI003D322179
MQQLWRYLQSALGVIFRHPITGTSVIPVLPDGNIVLIRRSDNGLWSLPGGIVNWGEDIPTSLERELEEETGLKIVSMGRLVGVYSSPNRDPRFHSICVAVEVNVSGSFEVQDKLEVLDIRAFTPGDIPKDELSHDHRQQLQDYFSGATRLA